MSLNNRYALTDSALWRDRVFSHNFVRTTYNRIFRRNSTFVSAILVGAIGVEIFFDGVSNAVFRGLNRGVRFPYYLLTCSVIVVSLRPAFFL